MRSKIIAPLVFAVIMAFGLVSAANAADVSHSFNVQGTINVSCTGSLAFTGQILVVTRTDGSGNLVIQGTATDAQGRLYQVVDVQPGTFVYTNGADVAQFVTNVRIVRHGDGLVYLASISGHVVFSPSGEIVNVRYDESIICR